MTRTRYIVRRASGGFCLVTVDEARYQTTVVLDESMRPAHTAVTQGYHVATMARHPAAREWPTLHALIEDMYCDEDEQAAEDRASGREYDLVRRTAEVRS